MIQNIDPELAGLAAAAFVIIALNKFRFFFVLSAKGNLLWTGVFTFLTVDLLFRRNEKFCAIDNTVLLAVCAFITVMLIVVPNLIPSLLRRTPL